ncbi:MAG: TolC family protein [Bdellovibrio sp.]|nr:TolC family protein [Bdellovibrio sp.]
MRNTSKLLISFFLITPLFASAATLQQAYQSALQKNETVGIAKEQVKQFSERVSQVKGGIYPQLALNATHLVQPQPTDPLARDFFPEKQTTINLAASQALFRGLREFAGLRQQKDLLASQEEIHRMTLVQIYADVATAYLNVLSLEKDIKNLEVQTKIYSERVGELGARARRGESNSNEVLTAQSTEAVLKADLELARGQLRTARETFAFLTGMSPQETLQDPDLTGSAKMDPLATYLKQIDNRYDIKAAQKQLEAMDEEVSIAKGAHMPSLDLKGNYYFKRPEGFTEDLKWDVQLVFSMPLFEGGTTQSKVREAASKRIEADLNVSRLRRLASQEISSYYETLQTRKRQIEALQNAATLSERNYQLMQRDYRRGLSRNIDVQQSLTDFRIASRALDQARFAVQMDLIKLQIASAQILAPTAKEE